jgi:hypothetical protein
MSRQPSAGGPPWLSDVPVVFAIMMLLIIIGLLHRIQSELHDG